AVVGIRGKLDGQEFNRQDFTDRRRAVTGRRVLPAGDEYETGAFLDKVANPVHALRAEIAGRNIAQNEQVEAEEFVAPREFLQKWRARLQNLGIAVHQKEACLNPAITQQSGLKKLVFPARRTLDVEHTDPAIDQAHRALE